MRFAAAFLSLVSMLVGLFSLITGAAMVFKVNKEESALLEDQGDKVGVIT